MKSSTEEYSLQVDKFNELQCSSVEHVIPNACRTLQEVYSKNSNTWLELLTNIVKIETNLIEKRSTHLKKLKMTISSVNPNDDQECFRKANIFKIIISTEYLNKL